MTAVEFSIRQAYGKSIDRYQRLLKTTLTELEREYVQRKLSEQQAAIRAIEQSARAAALAQGDNL